MATLLNSYIRPHNTNIDSDIVECGIGRSRSLAILCALTIGTKQKRKIYAYDSFAGFPEPTIEDASLHAPQAKEWSASPSGNYLYTQNFCRTVLESAEIPLNKVDLILTKVFFADMLASHPNRPIASLNINGDLYQYYKACLENLFDKVVSGGIILFDDFGDGAEEAFPGAGMATKEFLGDKEYLKIQQNEFGVFFYVKR